jgi:hypothetical protein
VNRDTCVGSDHCRVQSDTLVVQDTIGGFDSNANFHTCTANGNTRVGVLVNNKANLAFCCPAYVTGTVSEILSSLARQLLMLDLAYYSTSCTT